MERVWLTWGLLLFLFLLIWFSSFRKNNVKKRIGPTFLIKSCKNYQQKHILWKLAKKWQFQLTVKNDGSDGKWDLFIPCIHDYGDQKVKQLAISNRDQLIMGIQNKWLLGSKKNLWRCLAKKYGWTGARRLSAATWILPEEWSKFQRLGHHQPHHLQQLYVLKKDIQRQKGLRLCRGVTEVDQALKENEGNSDRYVIIQEYLEPPYLFQDHKVNLRVYLLLVCQGYSKKTAYLYDDGILSYTGKPYQADSSDFDQGVASFYTSEPLYAKGFPLTLSEFWSQTSGDLSQQSVMSQIRQILRKTLKAVCPKLCQHQFRYRNQSFELFGVDFFLDKSGRPKLIEINVGPGMSPYNDRDGQMRLTMYEQMFQLIGLIEKKVGLNRFQAIWYC